VPRPEEEADDATEVGVLKLAEFATEVAADDCEDPPSAIRSGIGNVS